MESRARANGFVFPGVVMGMSLGAPLVGRLTVAVLLSFGGLLFPSSACTRVGLGCAANAQPAPAGANASTASSSVGSTVVSSRGPSDTLELTGLQSQFQTVADRFAPFVVAISASITP